MNLSLVVIFNVITLGKCVDLSIKNVHEFITKESFAFVLFYADWNAKCKQALTVIDSVDEYFTEQQQTGLFVGKVDIYENPKIATLYRLDGYCVIKFFRKGSLVAESYKGDVNDQSAIKFIKSAMEDKQARHSTLVVLKEENFERVVRDPQSSALVFYHTPWCKKCTNLRSSLLKPLAAAFKNEKHCVIGSLDGEKHFNITVQEKIATYPNFKFYGVRNKDGVTVRAGKYDENWSLRNMTSFLNVHCKTKVKEEMRDKMDGILSELSVFVKRFIKSPDPRRHDILHEVISMVNRLPAFKRRKGDVYVKFMQHILQNGDSFIYEQMHSLEEMNLSEILEKAGNDLNKQRNVLEEFKYHLKDEL